MAIGIRPWRQSLAFKITAGILLLSAILTSAAVATLYSQIKSGLYREKYQSSQNLYSTIASAIQLQVILFQPTKKSNLKDRFDSIFSATNVGLGSNDHEIVLLPAKGNKHKNFLGTSDGVDPSTISNNFSEIVEKTKKISSRNLTLNYIGGGNANAYAVGALITLPELGDYELYVVFPLTDVEKSLHLVRNYLSIIGTILILLIGLTSAWFTQRSIKPVREAALIAEEFTSGLLDRRILIKGEDEMARLGRAFNEMAVVLSRQISRLENLSRLQQRFVSDVSHELRTPLTTMKMASGVIHANRDFFAPAVARSAELLQVQMERFEKLLADLLEVSRFDAQAAAVDLVEFDICATLERTIDYVLGADKTFLQLKLPEGPVIILADERRIERIFRNLITNAVDHRNEGNVEITVAHNEQVVSVGVRDYGVGFARKDSQRVFERFWRADPSRARSSGGTGLGLAISQEDALLHHGKIEAWGRPFHGANFVLTIPKTNEIGEFESAIAVIPEDEISTIAGIKEE